MVAQWRQRPPFNRSTARRRTVSTQSVIQFGDLAAANVPVVKPPRAPARWQPAHEYKLVALRECLPPEAKPLCDTPQRAADYWRAAVQSGDHYNPDCECMVVVLVDTRRRIMGHHLVSIGTKDTILCNVGEMFRIAIVASAAALVIMHNHPSGDATPSEADIKVTRTLISAGKLLNLEVLDHVIMGFERHASLRELGFFHS
jgi:proteasome lid subunit RPN8/RPN11